MFVLLRSVCLLISRLDFLQSNHLIGTVFLKIDGEILNAV